MVWKIHPSVAKHSGHHTPWHGGRLWQLVLRLTQRNCVSFTAWQTRHASASKCGVSLSSLHVKLESVVVLWLAHTEGDAATTNESAPDCVSQCAVRPGAESTGWRRGEWEKMELSLSASGRASLPTLLSKAASG